MNQKQGASASDVIIETSITLEATLRFPPPSSLNEWQTIKILMTSGISETDFEKRLRHPEFRRHKSLPKHWSFTPRCQLRDDANKTSHSNRHIQILYCSIEFYKRFARKIVYELS